MDSSEQEISEDSLKLLSRSLFPSGYQVYKHRLDDNISKKNKGNRRSFRMLTNNSLIMNSSYQTTSTDLSCYQESICKSWITLQSNPSIINSKFNDKFNKLPTNHSYMSWSKGEEMEYHQRPITATTMTTTLYTPRETDSLYFTRENSLITDSVNTFQESSLYSIDFIPPKPRRMSKIDIILPSSISKSIISSEMFHNGYIRIDGSKEFSNSKVDRAPIVFEPMPADRFKIRVQDGKRKELLNYEEWMKIPQYTKTKRKLRERQQSKGIPLMDALPSLIGSLSQNQISVDTNVTNSDNKSQKDTLKLHRRLSKIRLDITNIH